MSKSSGCANIELLSEFLSGSLPEAKNNEVEAHLASCIECAQELIRLTDLPVGYVDKVSHYLNLGEEAGSDPDNESALSRRIVQSMTESRRQQHAMAALDSEPVSTQWLEDLLGVPIESSSLPAIDRYQLDRLIHVSRMAAVFDASDKKLNREVCLKIPSPSVSAERFLNEARAVARLSHPNIVHALDFGEYKGTGYGVYEFVKGLTLAEVLAKSKPSLDDSTLWATQIAKALQYAHCSELYHRDVKPANILINESNDARLVDFGLSVYDGNQSKERFVIAGTLPYAPPEQIDGAGKLIDGRADVYSLGVVMYEMLTGRLPFQNEDREELRRAILNDAPRPPRQMDPKIPSNIESVVLKCLEKDSLDRHRSMADLLEELQISNPADQAAPQVIAGDRLAGQKLNSTDVSRSANKSNALVWIPAVLGLLILTGFVGLLAMNWMDQGQANNSDLVAVGSDSPVKVVSNGASDPDQIVSANGIGDSATPVVSNTVINANNPRVENLMASNAAVLAQTQSLLYLLQGDAKGRTREEAIQLIANSDRDLIILDASFDGSREGSWTQEDFKQMRKTNPDRMIIAYVSAGEAEAYRAYWNKKWDPENDGSPSPDAPPFLLREHKDWDGNYAVKFWHDQWQQIVFEMVATITSQGFDGVMLDRVDIFEDFELTDDGEYEDNRINPGTGRSYREDMVRFIEEVRKKQTSVDGESVLLIQNGSQLLQNSRLQSLLSGIVLEDLLSQEDEDRESIVECVNMLKGESPVVFAVEYPDDASDEAVCQRIIKQIESLGYRYLITDRDLETSGRSGK